MKGFMYLALTFVLVVSGVTYAYANVVRLVLIDFSNFRKVENNFYVSAGLSPNDEKTVISMLAEARERIATRYGSPTAEPVVVVMANKTETNNFGLYSYPGMFLFAPWNDYLLLNYETAGIDVMAHELVHAEIVERIGYLKRYLEIPTWFDEGAAMQVDFRPKYNSSSTIDPTEFERVITLNSAAKFWTAEAEQNVKNYSGAKAAVSALFKKSDEDLYSILLKIEAGNESVISTEINKTNQAFNGTP